MGIFNRTLSFTTAQLGLYRTLEINPVMAQRIILNLRLHMATIVSEGYVFLLTTAQGCKKWNYMGLGLNTRAVYMVRAGGGGQGGQLHPRIWPKCRVSG